MVPPAADAAAFVPPTHPTALDAHPPARAGVNPAPVAPLHGFGCDVVLVRTEHCIERTSGGIRIGGRSGQEWRCFSTAGPDRNGRGARSQDAEHESAAVKLGGSHGVLRFEGYIHRLRRRHPEFGVAGCVKDRAWHATEELILPPAPREFTAEVPDAASVSGCPAGRRGGRPVRRRICRIDRTKSPWRCG